MPKSKTTKPRQPLALQGLLECGTIGAAAKFAGVSTVTLTRWLGEPEFREKYREARSRLIEAAVGRLAVAMPTAVDVLLEVILDETAAPGARAQAAGTLLAHALKAAEQLELVDRVRRLEAAMETQERARPCGSLLAFAGSN